MSGKIKKNIAMILTASMVLSMNSVPAFAQEVHNDLNVDIDVVDAVDSMQDIDVMDAVDASQAVEETVEEENAASVKTAADALENETDFGRVTTDLDGEEFGDPIYPAAPDGTIKATLTKSFRVTVSWKKAKGFTCYQVYRMRGDGAWELLADNVKALKYTDRNAKFAETLVYKVVPQNSRTGSTGSAKYVIAAPAITNVSRDSYQLTDENVINTMDVDVSKIAGAEAYRIQRSKSKNKDFICINDTKAPENKGIVSACNGVDLGLTTGPAGIFKEAGVSLTRFKDANNAHLDYGKTYFYRVSSVAYIPEIEQYIESGYSKVVSGTMTERAPMEAEALHLSGTRLLVAFEDMTKHFTNNDADQGALAASNDVINIYAAMSSDNGATFGKYKKIASLTAGSSTLNRVKAGEKYSSSELLSDEDKAKVAPFDCVTYEAKNLKAEVTYSFKVQLEKKGVAGAKSDGNLKARTTLNELKKITVTSANFDAVSVSWNQVEGASGYQFYVNEASTEARAREMVNTTDWINSADKTFFANVKANKNGICKTTIKKLENMKYYVVAVRPTGYKKAVHVPAKDAADWALTKIAAPDVTVKQSKNTLTFTWAPVAKASGYVVEVTPKDGRYPSRETKQEYWSNTDKKEVVVENLTMGQPVTFKITTLYGTTGSDWKNNPEKWGNFTLLKEGLAPTTPSIEALLFNDVEKQNEDGVRVHDGNSTGALLKLKQSEATIKYTDSEDSHVFLGYRVYRSHKKNSAYVEITNNNSGLPLFDQGTAMKTTVNFSDVKDIDPGKPYYYRVYAVVKNNGNIVESRDYVQGTYCTPTSVSESGWSMTNGATKEFSLKFKPDETTMKEVKYWSIYDADSKSFTNATNEEGTLENSYIKAKVTRYATCANTLSPVVKVTAKKTGTTYLKAELVNGMEAEIKITISTKSEESGSTSGKCVVLDPGHGGTDSGTTDGGLVEKKINLAVSKATKEYLNKKGVTVYMTRADDSYIGLETRITKYLNKSPKCIVSQHTNSGSGKGIECYYALDGTGKSLATKLCEHGANDIKFNNRGAKTRKGDNGDYYAIIRYGRKYGATAVICENGFIQSDSDKLNTSEKLEAIGESNGKAILEWLNK